MSESSSYGSLFIQLIYCNDASIMLQITLERYGDPETPLTVDGRDGLRLKILFTYILLNKHPTINAILIPLKLNLKDCVLLLTSLYEEKSTVLI